MRAYSRGRTNSRVGDLFKSGGLIQKWGTYSKVGDLFKSGGFIQKWGTYSKVGDLFSSSQKYYRVNFLPPFEASQCDSKCRYIGIDLLSSRYASAHGGLFEGGGLFHKNYFRVGAYSRRFIQR